MLFIRANSVIEIPKHKQVIKQNKQETASLQTGLQNKAKVHLNQLSSSLINILCTQIRVPVSAQLAHTQFPVTQFLIFSSVTEKPKHIKYPSFIRHKILFLLNHMIFCHGTSRMIIA